VHVLSISISLSRQPECNTYACSFDGYDCTNQIQPFANCTAIKHGHRCYELFHDGTCDSACNSEECLYDGFDCVATVSECNPFYKTYCTKHFANGHCDEACGTPDCHWDGGDCAAKVPELSNGALVLILLIPPEKFPEVKGELLRELTELLHTAVWVMKDENGADMIYSWPDDNVRHKRALQSAVVSLMTHQRARRDASQLKG